MNLVSGIGSHRIGDGQFNPASGELRRDATVRRLEPRAAATLELLCAARGGVVRQDQIIQEVWNGRTLSDNSVAVVIGQLRKALDDDARNPTLIETIPKRGYRLVGENALHPTRPPRARVVAAAAVAIAAGIAAAAALHPMAARPEIAMTDIGNQTGDPRYDPLARATSELMLSELSKRGYNVERGSSGEMLIAGKLVMWNGEPYLGLSATDARGVVRWSGMTRGTADVAPAGLRAELDDFQRKVPR